MLSGSTLDLYVAEIQSRPCSHTFMYESVTRSEEEQSQRKGIYDVRGQTVCVFKRPVL